MNITERISYIIRAIEMLLEGKSIYNIKDIYTFLYAKHVTKKEIIIQILIIDRITGFRLIIEEDSNPKSTKYKYIIDANELHKNIHLETMITVVSMFFEKIMENKTDLEIAKKCMRDKAFIVYKYLENE